MNTDRIFQQRLEILSENMSLLPDKPEENYSNTLAALWLKASGNPVSVINAVNIKLPGLTNDQLNLLDELITQRINSVPLAHLTGRQSFMGIEMLAGPEALIPRHETEILGNTALKLIDICKSNNPTIIDVCTGAGNIAVALANKYENVKVYAADISEDAVELAKRNAQHVNVSDRVKFKVGDLLCPLEDLRLKYSVDIITCNPPYISTSKVTEMPVEISLHEPKEAFDGGAFGINLIRRLIVDAYEFLTPDGYLVFEVGLGQAEAISKLIKNSKKYRNIQLVNDDANNPRVIYAQKN